MPWIAKTVDEHSDLKFIFLGSHPRIIEGSKMRLYRDITLEYNKQLSQVLEASNIARVAFMNTTYSIAISPDNDFPLTLDSTHLNWSGSRAKNKWRNFTVRQVPAQTNINNIILNLYCQSSKPKRQEGVHYCC